MSARRSSSWSRHSCMTASAAGVLKSSSSAAAKRSQAPSGAGSARSPEHLAEALGARRGRLERRVRVVERLSPVAREEEDEQRLAPPPLERRLQRHVVADRLVHLLAGEAQHPVVHPDARERPAERSRLRDLVLVVREHEVEPAAVDLELRAEVLLRHDRALDVPARAADAPRATPTTCPRPACSPSRARSRADPPCARSAPAPRPDPAAGRSDGRTRGTARRGSTRRRPTRTRRPARRAPRSSRSARRRSRPPSARRPAGRARAGPCPRRTSAWRRLRAVRSRPARRRRSCR